ncbi:MAG TPA: hypothetical protein VI072_23570 [Polyangiaceae bacterium]
MFTRDVRFEGFTTGDWIRLAELFRPPPRAGREVERESAPDDSRREGGVIAVTTGERLRKLLSTRHGRLSVREEPWPASLEALTERHGARWGLLLQTGALEDLMDRFGERLRPEQDFLQQALLFVAVLRELEVEGMLTAWPWRLSQWPVPHERLLLRTLDSLCPSGKAIVLGVFDRGKLGTCLVARRRGTGFDYLLGPDDLRRDMGLLSGDWTRDYRHLVRAVEERVAPLSFGCFGEHETFRDLTERGGPGAWAEAVASREIILSPLVPVMAIPLGVDLGRAALIAAQNIAARISARYWPAPEAADEPASEQLERLPVFDRDVRRLLGFDPLAVLRKLLSRDARDA